MKKLFTSMLAASMVVSAFGISALAAESGTAYGEVPATSESISIDGEKDEIYDQGLKIAIADPDSSTPDDTTTGEAWLLWNGSDTLYAYVEVKDSDVIVYDGTPNAWETDSVELFLDYSNTVARTRDQYRIDIKGVATYYDTTTYTGDDTKAYGFEDWAVKETDDGYAVEFEIKAYNESISADMNVGFHLMINNMVEAGTRGMVHSDPAGNVPESFGYITLSGDTVEIEVPEEPAVDEGGEQAAQTSDLGIAVAAVSLAAASIALVALKKRK